MDGLVKRVVLRHKPVIEELKASLRRDITFEP